MGNGSLSPLSPTIGNHSTVFNADNLVMYVLVEQVLYYISNLILALPIEPYDLKLYATVNVKKI